MIFAAEAKGNLGQESLIEEKFASCSLIFLPVLPANLRAIPLHE